MALKKTPFQVFKHADLINDPQMGTPASVTGLSVDIDHAISNYQLFKSYFRSDFIAILLVTKGEITVGSNLNKYRLGRQDLFVAAPHTVKQVIGAKDGTRLTVVSFTADFVSRIGLPKNISELLDYLQSHHHPHWKLEKQETTQLMSSIVELKKRCELFHLHPFGKELLYHSFYIFLYEMAALGKRHSTLLSTRLSLKENLVMNYFQLVQKQYSKERTVQAYAAQLNVTAKYLTETVKEIAGKNAGEIVDDFVMLEAKLLLDNPSLSIGEIADMLNFSNQSFFGKYFKRFTGMSPKEYRKALP